MAAWNSAMFKFDTGSVASVMASLQNLISQEAGQAQAGNRIALAAAQSQIAEASAAATTQIANAGAAVAQAQSQELGQINQAKTNAQTQDQQLNQQMLDQLGSALQSVTAMAKQLSTGETTLLGKIQTIQTNSQKAISENIAALQKANGNRTSDWVKQANQDIENLLVKPLQTAINEVAAAAGFLGLVPGLEPLLVVAGAANLLNAGISAMEGNYLSAGMYGVMGAIPFAAGIAKIGELAEGAGVAVGDVVPAAGAAVEDAGQEMWSVLSSSAVVAHVVVGAVSGAVSGATGSALDGGSAGQDVLAGVIGAIFGGGEAFFVAKTHLGIVERIAVGAASSSLSNLTSQGASDLLGWQHGIDLSKVAASGISGAAAPWLSGAAEDELLLGEDVKISTIYTAEMGMRISEGLTHAIGEYFLSWAF